MMMILVCIEILVQKILIVVHFVFDICKLGRIEINSVKNLFDSAVYVCHFSSTNNNRMDTIYEIFHFLE